MDWALFIGTFWIVSLIPGLNMTLALSLGMALGLKKVQPLLIGATVSLGIVAFICAVLAGAILSLNPLIFRVFMIICALYLLYLAYKMFKGSKYNLNQNANLISKKMLFYQGFLCTLTNPKAWAFFVALIPPFLDKSNPFGIRLYEIIAVMMIIEYIDLTIYALGGATLKKILSQKAYILEKASAVLIAFLAILMLFGKF